MTEFQLRGACRGMHHVSVHNPTADKMFCRTCEDWVLRITGKDCPCCGNPARRPRTYGLCKTILNRIISSDYIHLIRHFTGQPTPEPVTLYCKYRHITYSVPLACAALYHDTIESKSLPEWTGRAWGPKDCAELEKSEVIRFCDRRIKGIGIG